VDIVSTGAFFWVNTGTMDVNDLPARAFDSPAQYAQTAALLTEYNANEIDPAGAGCESSLRWPRAHSGSSLPLPRVGTNPARYGHAAAPAHGDAGPRSSMVAISSAVTQRMETAVLGLLNVALVVAGWWPDCRRVPGPRCGSLPCAALRAAEHHRNSEPRYTLEMLPLLMACAACAIAGSTRPVRGPQKMRQDA